MNKIAAILPLIFLLSSCFQWESAPSNNSEEQAPKTPIASGLFDSRKLTAEEISGYAPYLSLEEQKIFSDLLAAEKIMDSSKTSEILKKIHEMEAQKRRDLSESIKAGDLQKASSIRKSLEIFKKTRN